MKTYKEPILKLHKLKMPITILAGSEGDRKEDGVDETEGGGAKQSTFFLDDSDFDDE